MPITFNPLSGQFDMLGGGSSSSSPLTTKGDLFGFSTVDARIPIGTDGYVLTADSTQSLGLKWAAGGSVDFNVDGGVADSIYGQITAIDGGTA